MIDSLSLILETKIHGPLNLSPTSLTILDFFREYKDLAVAIGWLVTMGGWWFTNSRANKRERRKEARAEVDACARMVYEILSSARQYYTVSPSNEISGKIKFELRRLISRAERLNLKYPCMQRAVDASGDLFERITGDDFESHALSPCSPTAIRIVEIEADVHQVIETLEDGFADAFDLKWRERLRRRSKLIFQRLKLWTNR